MNRKRAISLSATVAVLLGALTVPASNAAAQAKVTITWWSWTANPKTVIANFEKAYPNISVPTPAELRLGVHVLRQAHDRPCRRHRPLRRPRTSTRTCPSTSRRTISLNIAQYVSGYQKDYPAWVWGQVSQGSAVYAIPEDIGPMGLMYQPAVTQEVQPVRPDHLEPVRLGRWPPCTRPTPACTSTPSSQRPPASPGVAMVAGRGAALALLAQRHLEDHHQRPGRAAGHELLGQPRQVGQCSRRQRLHAPNGPSHRARTAYAAAVGAAWAAGVRDRSLTWPATPPSNGP